MFLLVSAFEIPVLSNEKLFVFNLKWCMYNNVVELVLIYILMYVYSNK